MIDYLTLDQKSLKLIRSDSGRAVDKAMNLFLSDPKNLTYTDEGQSHHFKLVTNSATYSLYVSLEPTNEQESEFAFITYKPKESSNELPRNTSDVEIDYLPLNIAYIYVGWLLTATITRRIN